MQGKVVRMRNGRLRRERQEKKMTVEMETGKGGFVWPDEEWSEEGKEEEREKMKRVEEERRRERGEERKGEREGEGSLRERKRALLGGRVRWRSSWVEDGGEAARAMGRV